MRIASQQHKEQKNVRYANGIRLNYSFSFNELNGLTVRTAYIELQFILRVCTVYAWTASDCKMKVRGEEALNILKYWFIYICMTRHSEHIHMHTLMHVPRAYQNNMIYYNDTALNILLMLLLFLCCFFFCNLCTAFALNHVSYNRND